MSKHSLITCSATDHVGQDSGFPPRQAKYREVAQKSFAKPTALELPLPPDQQEDDSGNQSEANDTVLLGYPAPCLLEWDIVSTPRTSMLCSLLRYQILTGQSLL